MALHCMVNCLIEIYPINKLPSSSSHGEQFRTVSGCYCLLAYCQRVSVRAHNLSAIILAGSYFSQEETWRTFLGKLATKYRNRSELSLDKRTMDFFGASSFRDNPSSVSISFFGNYHEFSRSSCEAGRRREIRLHVLLL